MSGPFLSDRWYRVAASRPRLREDVQPVRQRLRGQPWYVLHDRAHNRSHRFAPAAWLLASRLDGRTSVDALWLALVGELGEAAPSQDAVIRLLAQLHGADLLIADAAPDLDELLERRAQQQRRRRWQNLLNPMAMRFPLWDCDRFLVATLPWVRGAFTRAGLLIWLAWVLPALVLAGEHWAALTGNLADRLLGPDNLLLLALVFPLVKLLHELGHGYATRAAGGEVHELGIMLLVLAPAPYVDASAAGAFRSPRYRALVGAAGMMVELALAAGALYVWLAVEPGLVRALAFNVMAVAGVSTLVFNGNPLLRYDGYFILCDLIGIPNLAARSTGHWAWLLRRHAFGERELPCPPATSGERRWFLAYGPLAAAYRIYVALAIALFVAGQYFFVGVALAAWSLLGLVGRPLLQIAGFLAGPARLGAQRVRTWAVSSGLALALTGLIGFVPLPSSTALEGVVWVPAHAELRAGGDGRVQTLLAGAGTAVAAGTPVLAIVDEALATEAVVRRARVAELDVQRIAELAGDRAQAAVTAEALAEARSALAETERRLADLVVRAGVGGRVVLARAADLPERPVRRGDWLGYVLEDDELRTVRAVVGQDDIERVRHARRGIVAMPADRIGEPYPAEWLREVPAGSERLPARALAVDGGGRFATDPRDPDGTRALGRLFQLDLRLPAAATGLKLGTRVYLRIEHEPEPLARQWARRLRQLFLASLHV